MPRLLYRCVNESEGRYNFTQAGGCLAIMGRNENRVAELREYFRSYRHDTVDSVEFCDICPSHAEKTIGWKAELVRRCMEFIPFSECAEGSVEYMLRGRGMVFNTKDYPLNGVMMCMFHLRALCCTSSMSGMCSERVAPLDAMKAAMDAGATLGQAFFFSRIPYQGAHLVFGDVYGGDGSCFFLSDSVSVASMNAFVSGEIRGYLSKLWDSVSDAATVRELNKHEILSCETYSKRIKGNRPYKQNIQGLLANYTNLTPPAERGETARNLLEELKDALQNEDGDSMDLWGRPLRGSSVAPSNVKSAIRLALPVLQKHIV